MLGAVHISFTIILRATAHQPRVAQVTDNSVQLTTSYRLLSSPDVTVPLSARLGVKDERQKAIEERTHSKECHRRDVLVVFEVAVDDSNNRWLPICTSILTLCSPTIDSAYWVVAVLYLRRSSTVGADCSLSSARLVQRHVCRLS